MTHDGSASDWRRFHERLDLLDLPQRPDARIAARVATLIAGREANVLLLGVTRELAALGRHLTVVDWSRDQIERLWGSEQPHRRVVLADWRAMKPPQRPFSAVIGDGSLSTLAWPEDYAQALARVAEALDPGGRLVLRCYVAPEVPETVADIEQDVANGTEKSFHAMRWRLAMALAGRTGNVAVADIHRAFERAFPDRARLAERAGWSRETIGVIDAFRDSPLIYSFLTSGQLLQTLPPEFGDARFVPSGDYPLAERCPFLVADRI